MVLTQRLIIFNELWCHSQHALRVDKPQAADHSLKLCETTTSGLHEKENKVMLNRWTFNQFLMVQTLNRFLSLWDHIGFQLFIILFASILLYIYSMLESRYPNHPFHGQPSRSSLSLHSIHLLTDIFFDSMKWKMDFSKECCMGRMV